MSGIVVDPVRWPYGSTSRGAKSKKHQSARAPVATSSPRSTAQHTAYPPQSSGYSVATFPQPHDRLRARKRRADRQPLPSLLGKRHEALRLSAMSTKGYVANWRWQKTIIPPVAPQVNRTTVRRFAREHIVRENEGGRRQESGRRRSCGAYEARHDLSRPFMFVTTFRPVIDDCRAACPAQTNDKEPATCGASCSTPAHSRAARNARGNAPSPILHSLRSRCSQTANH